MKCPKNKICPKQPGNRPCLKIPESKLCRRCDELGRDKVKTNRKNKQSALPRYLWRDDGNRFSLNKDNRTYSMDNSGMAKPYKYTYNRLMSTGSFTMVRPGAKDLGDMSPVPPPNRAEQLQHKWYRVIAPGACKSGCTPPEDYQKTVEELEQNLTWQTTPPGPGRYLFYGWMSRTEALVRDAMLTVVTVTKEKFASRDPARLVVGMPTPTGETKHVLEMYFGLYLSLKFLYLPELVVQMSVKTGKKSITLSGKNIDLDQK